MIFGGPQVPIIFGILNLVLSNRLRPTQVVAPLPNMTRNPKFHWMVMGSTSLRVFSLSLSWSDSSSAWSAPQQCVGKVSSTLGPSWDCSVFSTQEIPPLNWRLQVLDVLRLPWYLTVYFSIFCLILHTSAPTTFVIPKLSLISPAAES